MIPVHEVIAKACKLRKHDQKVEWLRQNNHVVLRNILILTYDKTFELHVEPGVPYKPASTAEVSNLALYREGRKLKYLIKGGVGDNVPRVKLEMLTIELLETVSPQDALILEQMIERKPFRGLTIDIINEAFGPIIKVKAEGKDG